MLIAPNLERFDWLIHGFGTRNSEYPAGISTVRQVHSALVVESAEPGRDRFAEADAIAGQKRGVIVGVRTADCVPVLLADARTRAFAAVHAGWRGSSQNIVNAAVRELITRYGSRAEDLHAAIGPAIGVCCYEVGAEVARQFGTWIPELEQTAAPVHLDLAEINERQLKAAGCMDVWRAGECTFCEDDRYFSFRRERENAGRMLSFIGRSA